MSRHLLIGGTGRAGTSFLVQYLSGLGLDTHITRQGEGAFWDDAANAGLEDFPFGPGAEDLPYVIKQPFLYEIVDQMIASDEVGIDGVIIPVRSLVEASTSRTLNELRSAYERIPAMASFDKAWETMGQTAGGVIFSLNPLDQARLLAVGFHVLIERLVRADIPIVFLDFPRLVEDADYLFGKLRALLPADVSPELARETHAKLADPALVRVEREVAVRERPPQALAHFREVEELDVAAVKREVQRLRTEVAKGDDVLRTLQRTHQELERTTAAFHDQRKLAEEQREIAVGQRKLLAQQSDRIDELRSDLDRLNARRRMDRERFTRDSVALTDKCEALEQQYRVASSALETLSAQIEALCADRSAIEAYVGRLASETSIARLRALEAQRSEHAFLSALADEFGSVASPAERATSIIRLRQLASRFISQIESLHEQIADMRAPPALDPVPAPRRLRFGRRAP